MLIKINNGVFNLKNRIKKIDNSFYIVYNLKSKKYEVHSYKQRKKYCFSYPYDILTSQILNYAKKTSIKNLSCLMQEIEEHNLQKELNSKKEQIDIINNGLDVLLFLQNSSKQANFSSYL